MLRHWFTILIMLSVFSVGSYRASSQEATQPETDDGFRSIFDGKTLDGWDGDKKRWTVVDGAITGSNTADDPLKSNTFLIWDEKVSDFELQLKIKIVGGNTGIQYRSQRLPDDGYVIGGYQADFDAAGKWIGILYDEKGRGILAKRGQKVTIGDDAKPKVTGNLATEQKPVSYTHLRAHETLR